jgi:hypothetical protein
MFFNELVSGLWPYGYYEADAVLSHDFVRASDAFIYVSGIDLERIPTTRCWSAWGLKTESGIVKYTDIDHAIQSHRIVNLTNLLDDSLHLNIVDLGSGFGGMAEKLQGMASANVTIYLVDIPLNLVNAYAYLGHIFGRDSVALIKDRKELSFQEFGRGTPWKFILVPSVFSDTLSENVEISVLNNNGSLSEMDFETIEYYLETFLSDNTEIFVETNSNREQMNTGSHAEVPSSMFPVPASHRLISRTPAWPSQAVSRYVTSIYKRH